ncbi:gluconate 2-dehydrogenase alpha chain [Neobacillus niacini]|uniref:GMC family oxidoreductase n=1 Tax=Neobacillus niacini TaxID=86668 RepID=UPI00286261FC|nr:GMC family oxidoreductase [Neobacillus niacini]MDR7080219.1 gluconate 2-dehydrogenase alpha chain [Neobacillus niacini]
MVTKLPKVDVVTVGVGWMGAIVALELTKAGYKVVGLERGKDRSIADNLHQHDELRYGYGLRAELLRDPAKDTFTHRHNENQSARPFRSKMSVTMGVDVGGSGSHWQGQAIRFYPYDFEIRSKTIERYGVGRIENWMALQDWGITYDEIEPYYDKMEKTLGVSGEEDPVGVKRSNPYPNPPMPDTPLLKLFREAAKSSGYHPFSSPGAIATESYKNPDGAQYGACQYCAYCMFFSCEYGAKADPAVHVVPLAKKTGNYEVRTHAYVKRILYNGNKATGVLYVDTQTGEEFEQPAEIVALTAFQMNNVRLLLLSGIGKPYNPKNGTGVIGRNYTDHTLYPASVGYFEDKKFNLYAGSGSNVIAVTDFAGDNVDHTKLDYLHGIQITCSQLGLLPIGYYSTVPYGTPTWGKEFKKNLLHYTYRNVVLSGQIGFIPSKYNYLDLDPTYTDEYGDPLIRITNDYTDNDKKLAQLVLDKQEELLKAMGVDILDKGIVPEHPHQFIGTHTAGGAIMGEDPETSAVNSYMQMWDMDNLFVCGASAFPHHGVGNPTNTAGALTYRAAEGMIEYLKNGGSQ